MANTPGGAQGAPEMPPMPNMMPMLIVMIMIMGLYFIDGSNHLIGGLLNYVFQFINFGGEYPVLTLMMMGAIMIGLSTLIRSLKQDMIEQTKNQQMMSAFNAEFRQARIENNLYKVKKMTEMQSSMMAANMKSSADMMKVMPYTMLVIVPIFLWVRYFVDVTLVAAGTQVIAIPWSAVGVSLAQIYWFMPVWILVYTLVSIPLGQIVNRLIRAHFFRKRLAELDSDPEVVEVA